MVETDIQMEHADEMKAAFLPEPEAFEDRQHFVINLGILLSQTREGVKCLYLTEDEVVHVMYKNGTEKLISVDDDSYQAMVIDIVSRI